MLLLFFSFSAPEDMIVGGLKFGFERLERFFIEEVLLEFFWR
jgi:hypothetical protein